jgi:hypothetical protein
MEINRPKGIKPKMRQPKLRSGVNLRGTLMQKGVKQGLVVYIHTTDTTFICKILVTEKQSNTYCHHHKAEQHILSPP